jgi:hypothetical protein
VHKSHINVSGGVCTETSKYFEMTIMDVSQKYLNVKYFSISYLISMGLFYKMCKLKLSSYRCAGDKGESTYSSYSFLTSALGGGEWSASRLGRKRTQYSLDRRLGEPQSWSGQSGYWKNPLPLPGIEPRSSSL